MTSPNESKSMTERMFHAEKSNRMGSDLKHFGHESVMVKAESPTEVSSKDRSALLERVAEFIHVHQYDPNLPPHILSRAQSLLDNGSDDLNCGYSQQQIFAEIEGEQQLLLDDSPYAEARSVIPPTDDPTIPVNTFRVWVLGTVLAILGTGLNEFFGNRYPGIWVTSYVAQVVSFPCGITMARFLPTRRSGLGRWAVTLNPGPFNQKEHILIAVMSNVAFGNGSAYATTIFLMLKLDVFFGEKVLANSAGFRILLTLSTQLLGYGCAGIARRFLVYPPAMTWPSSLAQIALNRALHNDNGQSRVPGWRMSRLRFFGYCFVGMFVYFWLPGYLFQALSFFNWITWIAPNNVTLAIVTGSFCGLGLNPWPTFDWNTVSSIIDPIMTPFFSTVNFTLGLGISAFFIAPLLYWYNIFNTVYLPVNANYAFDNLGAMYNVSRVLNSDYTLDLTEYETYSTPHLGAGYIIALAASFAATPAVIVHVLLHHWTELKAGLTAAIKWKNPREAYKDVHNRLMAVHAEVPEWWFVVLLSISFIMGCIICLCYPTGLPIWTLFFSIALCIVLQIPIGMVYAVTNIEMFNNVLAEFIAGYAVPDRPIANMIFKAFGTMGCLQSVSFSQDLKLGHYLKVPPRIMFAAQTYATILAAFVSVGVNAWQMDNIKDLCEPTQENNFICPGANTFFSAAIIWGVVGPKRLFGPRASYNSLEWAFLVGAVLPIPFWLLSRKYLNTFVSYVHTPVILFGCLYLIPYNFSFVWPTCVFGFIFNFYIRRRYLAWWQRYAYVLTASFRAAIALAAIVIFFAVQLHDAPVSWWGNEVSFSGVDGGGERAPLCVLRTLADGERMPGT